MQKICKRSGLTFETENKRLQVHPAISKYTAHKDQDLRRIASTVIERGKSECWKTLEKFEEEIDKALTPPPRPDFHLQGAYHQHENNALTQLDRKDVGRLFPAIVPAEKVKPNLDGCQMVAAFLGSEGTVVQHEGGIWCIVYVEFTEHWENKDGLRRKVNIQTYMEAMMLAISINMCHGDEHWEIALGAEYFTINEATALRGFRPDLDGMVREQNSRPICEDQDGCPCLILNATEKVRVEWNGAVLGLEPDSEQEQ